MIVINNIRTKNVPACLKAFRPRGGIAKIFLSFAFLNAFHVGGHARQICIVAFTFVFSEGVGPKKNMVRE